jgi:hypothetical protein
MERLKPLRARASSQICYEVFRSNRPPPAPTVAVRRIAHEAGSLLWSGEPGLRVRR